MPSCNSLALNNPVPKILDILDIWPDPNCKLPLLVDKPSHWIKPECALISRLLFVDVILPVPAELITPEPNFISPTGLLVWFKVNEPLKVVGPVIPFVSIAPQLTTPVVVILLAPVSIAQQITLQVLVIVP